MKVIYDFCDQSTLSKECLEVGFSKKTSFEVSLDKEYIVYGISIWRKIIFYLIYDDNQLPNWYPSEIFKISNSSIPNNWKFAINKNSDEYSVVAVLGYQELTDIDGYYVELIERDKTALEIFANVVQSTI